LKRIKRLKFTFIEFYQLAGTKSAIILKKWDKSSPFLIYAIKALKYETPITGGLLHPQWIGSRTPIPWTSNPEDAQVPYIRCT
jgi:hypothetical protein